jgi:transposase
VIPPELEARILRLHEVEKWPIGTIAREVGVHHTVVRRVLRQAGQLELPKPSSRPSILDDYMPFILETLERYPDLPASRLHQMVCERGYPGGESHFRDRIAQLRPRKPAEAFLRLRTLPGEQAQVDWGHFGTVRIGRAERKLSAFVMVLSWSRKIFLRFYLDQRLENLLRGHQAALRHFDHGPRVILYDNPKTIVLERVGDAIRFHPRLLSFAAHYRFEPRPVAPYRGNEKGRVERAIRYVRSSFWPARKWKHLDDLNRQAFEWCEGTASARRCPEDTSITVGQAFEEEQSKLLPLPATDFPTHERKEVKVAKTPYVRFDGNDYSVPHNRVRRTLVVLADLDRLRVFDESQLVAEHVRTYDRGLQTEDPSHLAALAEEKAHASKHRAIDRLQLAAPASRDFLGAVAERGGNLGSATHRLVRLLETYGANRLQQALREVNGKGLVDVRCVADALERRRRETGAPPPLTADLPPAARGLHVQPHDLSAYDNLGDQTDDDQDEDRDRCS